MRFVCQFSCGAASAIATKIILTEHKPEDVLIVNAFVKEEHEDNRRFCTDCEEWFAHPITILRDEKYGASTLQVWTGKRFIKGPHGAPCSLELKRKLLRQILLPDDVQVFGFTAEEEDRYISLQELYPGEPMRAPLIERGITKQDCFSMIKGAGIELPMMYQLGYANANCIGCPKGGQGYWQNIRHDFPLQFAEISKLQQELGEGAYFLQFRSGPRKDERMSLEDLPPGRGDMGREPNFSCSFFCAMVEREWEKP
jgi:hypothetical protein